MPTLTVFGAPTFVALDLPTALPEAVPAVDRLLAEYARLRGEHQAAHADVTRLRNQTGAATEKDTWLLAAALRDGKKDPGTPNADKLAQDLELAERKAKALEKALLGCEADLRNAVAADSDPWVGRLDDRLDAVRDRLVGLVAEYVAAVDERRTLRAARDFATHGSGDYRITPGALNGRPDIGFPALAATLADDAAARPELDVEPAPAA